MQILVGADPELFIKVGEGKYRSAHGVIPGTKKEPHKVRAGAVQVDGLALEFNIDPAKDENEFVGNISTVLSELRNMVPEEYEFDFVPTANFHPAHLKKQPEEAMELGCEPDYNAYTMEENPRPDGTVNFRTAAGHIHIGFTEGADPSSEEHMMRCATLVKQLDVYLGVPSLFWDADRKRRSLYGKAGAFRPKSYGVEYRTLSNAWLKREDLVQYVYRQTVAAVESLRAGKKPEVNEIILQDTINNSNKYLASKVMKASNLILPIEG